MNEQKIQERLESLPALNSAVNRLREETVFRADNSVQFSPLLIITVISIIVQVIIHCRESKTDDELRSAIKDVRSLPPRRLMRLKRRVNAVYRQLDGVPENDLRNPILDAVYDMAEKVDDAAIDDLFTLVNEAAQ